MCIFKVLFLKKSFFFFFNMDYFLKSFIEFVTVLLLLFILRVFGRKPCGTLTPQPGAEPSLRALEEVLTTGVPRTFLSFPFQKPFRLLLYLPVSLEIVLRIQMGPGNIPRGPESP